MGLLKKVYRVAKYSGALNLLSDEVYTKLKYRVVMGKAIDLDNPRTFTEKLNWLKLYDHDPKYIPLVDKWEVMKYVQERIGSQYCVEKFGVWDSFDDIDFDLLPNQFVLKCTHDSGSTFVCKDKSTMDMPAAKRFVEKCMAYNYYWYNREWAYRKIKPRILAEAYLSDESQNGIADYKFFCFDGKPQFMFIATGRAEGDTRFDFFDMEFNWIPVKQHYPNADVRPQKPECFDEMRDLAEKLSDGLKHVRVDFFQVNGRVYFSELTFNHFGGYERFEPQDYDSKFGMYLNLQAL